MKTIYNIINLFRDLLGVIFIIVGYYIGSSALKEAIAITKWTKEGKKR